MLIVDIINIVTTNNSVLLTRDSN